jgi:hypothetical protein
MYQKLTPLAIIGFLYVFCIVFLTTMILMIAIAIIIINNNKLCFETRSFDNHYFSDIWRLMLICDFAAKGYGYSTERSIRH